MKKDIFFDLYKKQLDKDKKLTQDEVDSIDVILNAIELNEYKFSTPQYAYILATVFHETNGCMKPVKEAYYMGEDWRKKNLKYYPYYGRDFVHTTWRENYLKFSKVVGVDLVANPDKISDINIALKIMLHGFYYGTFTGKKISDYIASDRKNYVLARKCINGQDKAQLIASYANIFENILIKSA